MTDHTHEDELDCKKALAALYVYIDYRRGLDPPVESSRLQMLLHHYEERCGGCAEVADVEYRFLARVKRACEGGEAVPDDLVSRVRQRLLQPGATAADGQPLPPRL